MRPANQVQIVGNLGRDPYSGKSKAGIPYMLFSLAEDSAKKLVNDERVKKTRWHDCVVWGEVRCNLLRNISKGEKLLIQGQLDYDRQTVEIDGKERDIQTAKVVVSEFLFLQPRKT